MNTDVMFSSNTDMWETPEAFFRALDAEFHFTLDVCAVPENANAGCFTRRSRMALLKSGRGSAGAIHRMDGKSGNG